ncbi:MAG: hypothetical protein AAFP68_08945 [Pseudomonadota bacterium]
MPTGDLKDVRTENLRKLVDETEATLAELHTELDRREEAEQHREIDRLDQHMKSAELSLTSIRDFFDEILNELRGNTSR